MLSKFVCDLRFHIVLYKTITRHITKENEGCSSSVGPPMVKPKNTMWYTCRWLMSSNYD